MDADQAGAEGDLEGMMADRPIIFSAPMVRALLEGRKTMTRRVIKPQPAPDFIGATVNVDGLTCQPASLFGSDTHKALRRIPRPGDRLYVREAWRVSNEHDEVAPRDLNSITQIWYEADRTMPSRLIDIDAMTGKLRPGIHMPRWASRLTLTVTDVRVQRLQEISEEDARDEGVLWVPGHGEITPADLHEGYSNYLNCREGFQVLWDSLNADRGYGWDTNPWVAALSFSVVKENIDSLSREAA